jgi:hypothetical protein
MKTWTDPLTGIQYTSNRDDGSRPPAQILMVVRELKLMGKIVTKEDFNTDFEWQIAQQESEALDRE